MNPEPLHILCDSREPGPVHPWAKWLPSHVTLERACLPTGDFALQGYERGAIVERKTRTDLLACIGGRRQRFEAELVRAGELGAFCVVVEGGLIDLIHHARGIHPSAIMGTLAAWQRRHCGFVFASTQQAAAVFALKYLAGQITDGHRIVKAAGAVANVEVGT